jgi:uncharacterized membrane protein YagU involved in acid resistance
LPQHGGRGVEDAVPEQVPLQALERLVRLDLTSTSASMGTTGWWPLPDGAVTRRVERVRVLRRIQYGGQAAPCAGAEPGRGRLMRAILRGAVAGAIATIVMSVHMLWARRTDRVDALSPEHITDAAFDAVSHEPSTTQHVLGTTIAHLGFGAGTGVVLAAATRGRRVPWWGGTAYGLAVAAVSYQGWVPALGILPPLRDAPPGRRNEIIISHLIYGNVLVELLNRSRQHLRAGDDTGVEDRALR